VLFAGTFLNRFGGFVFVFLTLYLVRSGHSEVEAGIAVGAYGVGSIAAGALGGWAADRLARRNAIALSMFASAAVMLVLSQARAIWLIVLLAGLAGTAAELYRPAAAALLADLAPPGRRVTVFALYRLSMNLGFAAGTATAGLLAERSFTLLFVGDALTSVAFGAIALAALPAGAGASTKDQRRGELLRAVAADRRFLLFLLASCGGALLYFQQTAALPLHVRDEGFSMVVFGALLSVNGLVVIALELPLTAITARLPAQRVIATGLLLSGVGFSLTGVAHSVPALALTVMIWTLGEIVFAPVAHAYVADIAPDRLQGRYQGMWGMSFSIGLVLSPIAGATLYAREPSAVWLACFALGVICALLVLVPTGRTTS
jgi:MFS family permease